MPTHVWVEQMNEGDNAALQIKSQDQANTLFAFRAA